MKRIRAVCVYGLVKSRFACRFFSKNRNASGGKDDFIFPKAGPKSRHFYGLVKSSIAILFRHGIGKMIVTYKNRPMAKRYEAVT
jgi:hypothetical protein